MVKGKAGGGFTGRRLKAQWERIGVDPEAIFLRRVNKPPSCEQRLRPSNVGFRRAHRGRWWLTFLPLTSSIVVRGPTGDRGDVVQVSQIGPT